ncbi:MAG: IPT/TIG domain-containing protein [Bryobacteraceae bacterium]
MKTKTTLLAVLFLGACAGQLSAQSFDSSGDGMLSGAYYFRQVIYLENSNDSMSLTGTITFDGKGNYTLSTATLLDQANGSITPQPFSGSGTYSIAASGEGFLTAVNTPDFPNDLIIGLVSPNGVFIGSSTENTNQYNDLFIAAPAGSPTVSTLSGSYQVAYFDPTYPGDGLLSFSADGGGNAGTVNLTEYLGSDTTTTTGSISGVTYSFSNGVGQINLGPSNTNNLVSGTEQLFTTPDGKFFFGGNYNGFDIFVGVQNATSNPSNVAALYYQAGINIDESSNNNGLDSYFGATNILPASAGSSQGNNIIADERDNSLAFYGGSSDYTYYDFYTVNGDGSASDSYYSYWASQDGTIRVGYGPGPELGINVAFQAPSPSGPGVYISPIGFQNAASNAPFTTFVSPGEFLTLYGSGLAPTTVSTSVPFSTNVSGVQVMIGGTAAPIYFVSPNEIDVVVPYEVTPGSVAQIQVINNGANSNVVTQFIGETSVGVFTNNPENGIGYAAALRPDGSIISEANPAPVGETEAVYLAGMGTTSNQPADGAAAPSSPLADTNSVPSIALFDSAGNAQPATVTFSGLAPGFAGLYQIDFTIPSGLVNGDTELDVFSGVDSESVEALLPITGGTSAARANVRTKRHHLQRRRRYAIENRLSKRHP